MTQKQDCQNGECLSEVVRSWLTQYFHDHAGSLPKGMLYQEVIAEVERPLLVLVLEASKQNQSKAADLLGINRNTLRARMKALGIAEAKPRRRSRTNIARQRERENPPTRSASRAASTMPQRKAG